MLVTIPCPKCHFGCAFDDDIPNSGRRTCPRCGTGFRVTFEKESGEAARLRGFLDALSGGKTGLAHGDRDMWENDAPVDLV